MTSPRNGTIMPGQDRPPLYSLRTGPRHTYRIDEQLHQVALDEAIKHVSSLSRDEIAALDSLEGSSDLETAEQRFAELLGRAASPGELTKLISKLRDDGVLEDGRTHETVRAALKRRWQEDNLRALALTLAVARTAMPLYRDRIPAAIRGPTAGLAGSVDLEQFFRIPLLSRSDLRRAFPTGFYTDADEFRGLVEAGQVGVVESSGIEGDARLSVFSDFRRRSTSMLHTQFMNRELFPGHELIDADLTSLHHLGLLCVADLPQMQNRIFDNSLRLLPPEDITFATPAEVKRTCNELRAHMANWLFVNPTYLAHLTWKALEYGVALPKIRVITTSYEYLSANHRRFLTEAWGCPVNSMYLVTEMPGGLMVECERGNMHVNDRFFYLEALREGVHARPGECGRLVATTLRGSLPLVRYDVGDLILAAEPNSCACQAVHSCLGRLAGHVDDALVLPGDRLLTLAEVDDQVSGVAGIRFYKLIQRAPQQFTLEVVPDPDASFAVVAAAAEGALHDLLGPEVRCEIRRVRVIFPEANGKFRLVVPAPGTPKLRAGAVTTSANEFRLD